VLLLATVLLVMGFGPDMARQIAWAQTDARITRIQHSLSENPSLAELSDAFRKVAQVVEPSVVHIEILSTERPRQRRSPFGTPWEDFFERRGIPQHPDIEPMPQEPDDELDRYNAPRRVGNGSGWVFDDQGHIITNNHVVENADEIRVKFNDGSERDATVVGRDARTDVAVLKVEGGGLHPAVIGTDDVEAGDIVFAFGSPFGFSFSMSQGIVSAKGRQLGILGASGYEQFIQTDAAINPGNSGGPLTNIYGEVIGVNTAIASGTGAYNGLGFAIPVAMVKQVAEQILTQGKVTRGYLGIYIEDLDAKMARTYGFDGKGVLVVDAIPDGPAAEAGIQSEDIVTAINDQPVTSADALRYMVADMAPGTEIDVTLFRQGETQTVQVTLTELPGEQSVTLRPGDESAPPVTEGAETLRKFGIQSLENFTESLAQQMNVPFQPGVIVGAVRAGSRAAAAGIQRGTLITAVMGQPVATVDELTEQMTQLDPTTGIRMKLMVWDPQSRAWMTRLVALQLPKD
jgi:serine protease Do